MGITTHWAETPNNPEYTRKVFNMGMAEFANFVGLLASKVTMAHKIKGGKTGVGVAKAPMECFTKAIKAFSEKYGI